mmetsp:Transcript_23127/g.50759  ORF Transcript_23127/g.50759 Transcript_23127/m.50759 type:complete len:902 (-) Transcript_23127:3403-6108(-)
MQFPPDTGLLGGLNGGGLPAGLHAPSTFPFAAQNVYPMPQSVFSGLLQNNMMPSTLTQQHNASGSASVAAAQALSQGPGGLLGQFQQPSYNMLPPAQLTQSSIASSAPSAIDIMFNNLSTLGASQFGIGSAPSIQQDAGSAYLHNLYKPSMMGNPGKHSAETLVAALGPQQSLPQPPPQQAVQLPPAVQASDNAGMPGLLANPGQVQGSTFMYGPSIPMDLWRQAMAAYGVSAGMPGMDGHPPLPQLLNPLQQLPSNNISSNQGLPGFSQLPPMAVQQPQGLSLNQQPVQLPSQNPTLIAMPPNQSGMMSPTMQQQPPPPQLLQGPPQGHQVQHVQAQQQAHHMRVPSHTAKLAEEAEMKKQRRKQSNRESARRSRLRKQAETEVMGTNVSRMLSEMDMMRDHVENLLYAADELEAHNEVLQDCIRAVQAQRVLTPEVQQVESEARKAAEEALASAAEALSADVPMQLSALERLGSEPEGGSTLVARGTDASMANGRPGSGIGQVSAATAQGAVPSSNPSPTMVPRPTAAEIVGRQKAAAAAAAMASARALATESARPRNKGSGRPSPDVPDEGQTQAQGGSQPQGLGANGGTPGSRDPAARTLGSPTMAHLLHVEFANGPTRMKMESGADRKAIGQLDLSGAGAPGARGSGDVVISGSCTASGSSTSRSTGSGSGSGSGADLDGTDDSRSNGYSGSHQQHIEPQALPQQQQQQQLVSLALAGQLQVQQPQAQQQEQQQAGEEADEPCSKAAPQPKQGHDTGHVHLHLHARRHHTPRGSGNVGAPDTLAEPGEQQGPGMDMEGNSDGSRSGSGPDQSSEQQLGRASSEAPAAPEGASDLDWSMLQDSNSNKDPEGDTGGMLMFKLESGGLPGSLSSGGNSGMNLSGLQGGANMPSENSAGG